MADKISSEVPRLSDLAACEKDIEGYLARLPGQHALEPEGYFPFAVSRERTADAFSAWLKGLSLVPGDLTTTATLNTLEPKFVPFWVASSMTYTSYKGERGENYKDKESYTDANGHAQTREVTRTSWEPVSGEVRHHFEHVPLCACSGLAEERMALLRPVNLQNLSSYGPGATGDAAAEKAALDGRAAFARARSVMEAEIKKLVEKSIGGAQRKVSKMETRHVNIGLKLVLVPCYTGSFRYKNKDYPIFMHGVTGELRGEHPVSAGKVALVALLMLGILAAFAAALWFFLIGPAMK